MKGGLRSLGAAFGVSLGVAGAVGMGKRALNAQQAEARLRQLTQTTENFGKFRSVFEDVNARLESMRKGVSGLFHQRQFDEAAANFVEVFGAGKEELDAFGRIWQFSAAQAAATRGSVVDIAKSMQDAAESGGFESLKGLPGFTKNMRELAELQQQSNTIGGYGFAKDRNNRLRAISEIASRQTDAQKEVLGNLKKVPSAILVADTAADKLQKSLEKLGDIIANSLVKPLERVAEILERIAGGAADISKRAAKAGVNPSSMALAEVAKGTPVLSKILGGLTAEQTAQGISKGAEYAFTEKGRSAWLEEMKKEFRAAHGITGTGPVQKTEIHISNEFNIQATDPKGTLREVSEKMKDNLEQTRLSTTPTERR
jgi:hypothetical protein